MDFLEENLSYIFKGCIFDPVSCILLLQQCFEVSSWRLDLVKLVPIRGGEESMHFGQARLDYSAGSGIL